MANAPVPDLAATAWWGPVALAPGSAKRWQIGPLTLTVERQALEWRVILRRTDDPLDSTLACDAVQPGQPVQPGDEVLRIADDDAEHTLTLLPKLADLDIVSRPEAPFIIPPGREATIFVGTPLWITLNSSGQTLLDVPIAPPRRTWFGDRESGQLAYASRTFCATTLDELVPRPHRARSAVTIKNRGDTNLSLSRILLPTAQLSLAQGDDGHLWTEDLALVRHDDELAQLQLTPRDWKQSHSGATRISAPRVPESRSALVRVFAPLLDP